MFRNRRLFISILTIFAVSFFALAPAYGIVEEEKKTEDRKKVSYAPGRAIFKLKESPALRARTSAASVSSLPVSELPSNLRTVIQNHSASTGSKIERVFKQAGRSGTKLAKTQALQGTGPVPASDLERVFKLKIDPSENIESLCQDILLTGEVEYCEPDYLVTVQSLPSDTYIDPDQNGVWSKGAWGQDPFNSLHPEDLWGLKKIKAAEAWNAPGNPMGQGVVVAVTDTGVDYKHEDLTEDANANGIFDSGEDQNGNGVLDSNIWTNLGEIPNNGVDDDGNGYVDDVRGWDFVTFDGTSEDKDPMDDHGHGTHVSGTIAAIVNNNRGIAGVAPKAKIMALKGLNQYGSGSNSDLSNAILYAADNGAHVINASWGGFGTTPQVLIDAINYAHNVKDVVFVAAAGNSNQDVGSQSYGFSPANIRDAVTVSAFDGTDTRAYFSNFGVKIDVAAPGGGDTEPAAVYDPFRSILSLKSSLAGSAMTGNGELVIGTNYLRQAGTSMAAPHVAGVAALIRGLHPDYSAEQVRQVLRKSSNDIEAVGFDTYSGYGRVNALNTVNAGTPIAAQIAEPSGTITGVDQVSIKGTVSGPGLSFWNLEYGAGSLPSTWTQIASGSQDVINNVLTDWNITEVPDGTYTLRLTAQNTAGQAFEDRVIITIDQIVITEPSPTQIQFFRPGQMVTIRGTVNPANFMNYTITITNSDGVQLVSTNITLTNGGLQKVVNGVLGTWDTTNTTTADHYWIHLSVALTDATTISESVRVVIDPTLHEGWPITIEKRLGALTDHITVADINGDGADDLIIGYGDTVRIFDVATGQNLPGWPQSVNPEGSADLNAMTQKGPAVGDLDGDGSPEVVAVTNASRVFVWHADGSLMTGWPRSIGGTNSSLAIADVDGNGTSEIIASDWGTRVKIIDAAGAYLPGWPVSLPGVTSGALNSPAVGDVDGDGKKEIAVMGLLQPFNLYLLSFDGRLLPGWPQPIYAGSTCCYYGHPTLADIDADGDLEILSGSPDGYVHAFHHDGTNVDGWPQFTQLRGVNSVAIGDINGDGDLEIVAGSNKFYTPDFVAHSYLYAWRGDGSLLPGWPVQFSPPYSTGGGHCGFCSPVIADVNGDGMADVVVSNNAGDKKRFGLHAYQSDGTMVDGFPKPTHGFFTAFSTITSAVADLDGDGLLELVWLDWFEDFNGSIYTVYVWDLEAHSNSPRPWPMFMHDPQHTGRYEPPNLTPEITSYLPADLNPSAQEGKQIRFSVAASDPDNDPLTYEWRLNDVVQSTSSSWMYSPDFNSAGAHTISVAVSDGINSPVTVSWTVSVLQNNPPQITSISSYAMQVTSPIQATVGQKFYWTVYVRDPDPGTEDIHQLTVTFNDGQNVQPLEICGTSNNLDLCYYRAKTIGCDCNDNRTRVFYPVYITVKPEWAGQSILFTFTPLEALPNVNPGTPVTITINVGPTDASIVSDMEKVIWNHLYGFNPEVPNPFPGFDLNGNGSVNSTDVILMRNIWNLPYEKFVPVFNKFMGEVTKTIGARKGDARYIPQFDIDKNGIITAAADRGRILTALNHGRTSSTSASGGLALQQRIRSLTR